MVGSRSRFESIAVFVADRAWLAKAVAATAIGTELLFPLALVWRRSRPAFATLAIGLHAGTWLLLGLDYWAWIAVDLLVVVDWTSALSRAAAVAQRARSVKRATPSANPGAKITAWPRRSSRARPSSSVRPRPS